MRTLGQTAAVRNALAKHYSHSVLFKAEGSFCCPFIGFAEGSIR